MLVLEAYLLTLLLVANGTPVVLDRLFGGKGARPVDGGYTLSDGRPLLGASKTWRGVLGAVVFTALISTVLGGDWLFGGIFGLIAMLADLLSSFLKRRLGWPASAQALFLDQLPESLLPLLYAWHVMTFPAYVVLQVTVLFFLIEVFLSPVLFRIGLRKRPH